MNDVLHMLLGAALVCLGVLATAFADRVRQLRITRRDSTGVLPRETARTARKPTAPASDPGSEDVIAALQGAGYKKALATQAALACTEREQATPEIWMAAALRRCAQGGAA
jgi:hypothetical protein